MGSFLSFHFLFLLLLLMTHFVFLFRSFLVSSFLSFLFFFVLSLMTHFVFFMWLFSFLLVLVSSFLSLPGTCFFIFSPFFSHLSFSHLFLPFVFLLMFVLLRTMISPTANNVLSILRLFDGKPKNPHLDHT
eukprot:TRINITY_DN16368_c0_g1_i2.p3 TRINITY_DN16368_c0_g1~~TRINITY_DN16368_c0_g1_i2.p3  ORF type:complete len:131 (+),score=9.41 TRINITY_DN16368_c0_g1_i2:162-554(+)